MQPETFSSCVASLVTAMFNLTSLSSNLAILSGASAMMRSTFVMASAYCLSTFQTASNKRVSIVSCICEQWVRNLFNSSPYSSETSELRPTPAPSVKQRRTSPSSSACASTRWWSEAALRRISLSASSSFRRWPSPVVLLISWICTCKSEMLAWSVSFDDMFCMLAYNSATANCNWSFEGALWCHSLTRFWSSLNSFCRSPCCARLCRSAMAVSCSSRGNAFAETCRSFLCTSWMAASCSSRDGALADTSSTLLCTAAKLASSSSFEGAFEDTSLNFFCRSATRT
mmetsp:Transcript_4942/g.12193  ORF Transcript_4942/g.12193 Transcript_4942/m.12193 type:complete len:285 (+) Transcript_4942:395-1249(+)